MQKCGHECNYNWITHICTVILDWEIYLYIYIWGMFFVMERSLFS